MSSSHIVCCRANTEGESRTGSGAVDQRLGSNSPSQQQQQQQQQQQGGMDPNNAAYLALRNHPETTIRPISSGGQEQPGPGQATEHSPGAAAQDNIFKQVRVAGRVPQF